MNLDIRWMVVLSAIVLGVFSLMSGRGLRFSGSQDWQLTPIRSEDIPVVGQPLQPQRRPDEGNGVFPWQR